MMTRWLLVLSLALAAPVAAEIEEGPVDEGPLDEAPISKLPVLKRFVQAVYPERAFAEGVTAVVVLEIDLDASGLVEAVRLAEPVTPAGYGFEEAALVAVSQFEFEPAEAGGLAVPVRITYRYGFVIEAKPEPAPGEAAAPAIVNLRGVVLERGTRLPLAGVLVTVFQGEGENAAGFEASTNAAGHFELVDLPEGSWRVLIDPDGYFPFRTSEQITAGEVTEVVYYVEKGSYNPFDVLVEAERPRKEVTRRTLERDQIEKVPGNFGDPIKVVQTLPGVARTPTGSGEIIVRGSSPEDTLVFVEGIATPIIYHFGGLRSVIPVGMLERLDFLPGNFSSYYGRAMGGVLDVGIRRLRPDALHGYADVNVFDSGVYLEAPIGDDIAVAVAGRRSYVDFVLDAVIPEDSDVNAIAAPRFYDYQVLASWRPSPEQEARVFFFGADDKLELVLRNPADASTQLQSGDLGASTAFWRALADHRYAPSEAFQNDVRLSVGTDTFAFNLGEQFEFRFDLVLVQVRELARYELNSALTVSAGLDTQLAFFDGKVLLPMPPKEGDRGFSGEAEPLLSLIEDTWLNFAPFLEVELKPTEALSLIAGLRVDYFDAVTEWSVAPRVSARYALDPQWALVAGAGLYHQPPTPDEIDLVFGNPTLALERAGHYSLGVEYKPLEFLEAEVTFFYKDMAGLVARSGATVERDGEQVPLIYENHGLGRVYGAEVLVRHDFHENFYGWLTYTISKAERLDPDTADYRLFDFDQTHILTLVAAYQLPRNWEIGVRWRLVSGNPATPITGGVFRSDIDWYEATQGAVNSTRLPPFHQLDVRIDKRWIYDDWMLTLYLDLQNTYNQANVEGYSYNFDFSQREPQQGLPVLPILGLKGEF